MCWISIKQSIYIKGGGEEKVRIEEMCIRNERGVGAGKNVHLIHNKRKAFIL